MPRVVLHIGTPKSGTTYLQRALRFHSAGLRRAGVNVPDGGGPTMFHAAIELRDAFDTWGKDRAELTGTWDRVCGDARSFAGTTIMSHELLVGASPEEVAATYAGLDGLEVDLVVTARDLARQVTSEWQERVKNGATVSFAEFRRRVQRYLAQGDWSSLFWRQHHVVGILDRWAGPLSPERVHVVVAPPSGGDPAILWQRFGDAAGFDASAFDPAEAADSSNAALGTAQVAVLRKVNAALGGALPPGRYHRVVKRQFAQRLLAAQPGEKPVCPPDLLEDLTRVAVEQNEQLRARGYRIHGDLSELIPAAANGTSALPDDVSLEEQLDASITALADLLADRGRPGGARRGRGPRRLRSRLRRGVGRALRLRARP